jgi:hypothetical protein
MKRAWKSVRHTTPQLWGGNVIAITEQHIRPDYKAPDSRLFQPKATVRAIGSEMLIGVPQ